MKMQLVATALVFYIVAVSAAHNITKELEADPNYSEFNNILTSSGLAKDINSRNSITVAALTNQQIDQLRSSLQGPTAEKQLADICRVQIFLSFINPDDNTKKSINGNQQMTSLYQTTGKAPGQDGVANITVSKSGDLNIVMSSSNATITKSVKQIGYNLSIVEVSNPLLPTGVLALAPAPAPPPSLVPTPAPVPVAPAPAATAPTPAGLVPNATSPAGSASDSNSGAGQVTASFFGCAALLVALLW